MSYVCPARVFILETGTIYPSTWNISLLLQYAILILMCIINLLPVALLIIYPFYRYFDNRYEKKQAERKELLRKQWIEKRELKRLEEQKRLEAEAAATTELMLEPLNEPMN